MQKEKNRSGRTSEVLALRLGMSTGRARSEVDRRHSRRWCLYSSCVRITTLSALVCMSLSTAGQTQNLSARLDILLQQKKYSEFEQALLAGGRDLPAQSHAYFQGVLSNRVNTIVNSIALLEPLIPSLLASNRGRAELAVCTLADDYAKGFRYKDAARTYAEAQNVATQQGTESICQAGVEASRWALLDDAPVQTVQTNGEFKLSGKRDSIGLLQVPITAGDYAGFWILDTGANLSVIRESLATRLGLKVSSVASTVAGASGASIRVHAGVIPELRLGPAVVRNVAVLVAQDSDLRFPNMNYEFEGSLGLPVLAAFGEVTVFHDGYVRFGNASIPSQDNPGPHNLFFEKLTPLVTADLEHGPQLFTIDTGAIGTILSAEFYDETDNTDDFGDLVTLELSGAGGRLFAPAYQIHGIAARMGGRCATLDSVLLLMQPTRSTEEFYGNIGLSALSSFMSFSFDFKNMHFSVKGGAVNCATKAATYSSLTGLNTIDTKNGAEAWYPQLLRPRPVSFNSRLNKLEACTIRCNQL